MLSIAKEIIALYGTTLAEMSPYELTQIVMQFTGCDLREIAVYITDAILKTLGI